MNECLFCKIVKKEIPAEVVGENESALAFLDIHPHAPGHTVVIPKDHRETLIDLSEQETASFFSLVKTLDKMLVRALHAGGMTIGVNQGEVGGQVVEHFHLHLMPRFMGDGGTSVHAVVKNPPKEAIAELGERIRGVAGKENS